MMIVLSPNENSDIVEKNKSEEELERYCIELDQYMKIYSRFFKPPADIIKHVLSHLL